jgi:hypothetical protein
MDTPHDVLTEITDDLLDERDAAIREREAADARVKSCNIRLEQLMTLAGAKRHQHTDGSVIQIVSPTAREVVVPEQLLARGVAPHIIKACTRSSPVKAHIRVDRPKPPDEAGVAVDQPLHRDQALGDGPTQ